ncbi:DegT/DnrJ/EryC1/StrS aminotransferase family protein [Citricoccus sp. I39-566]|uniref:DegT/DnrJ/EryC1/StrS family aminotransferase n=1 Tax=Citricoccus sp. I39-566 TaxID=3073268 RepID=UPI00286A15C4|nr:DegT/DnrJ/EryC1/StrS aminotransferase family protein [Citricoccus sp. I39-566]WMY78072.1 DegT/DnrJ/EryC1/StrS aminotransferase family protein [Citricoccus sp. I39-566]
MTETTVNDAFLPFARPDITEAEIEAVTQTIRSGWLTTGPNAAAFEKEMAEFLGGGDITCVAVNSATAGLHLAVEALGIGPGDEVLVPTWTFTSTAEVVRYVGADPVLVDVDPVTLNIDFSDAEQKLTGRTKAVMPVHLAGIPVDARELEDFATRHQLLVIEDAAHAFPVKSNGKFVGNSTSDAVVFSFYATKTITTGEGGMVMVRSEEKAQRMRTMRLHGISRDVFNRYQSTVPAWRYDVVAPGFKYNLPDTAAAMGRVQLGRAVEMRDKRRAIAHRYLDAFRDLPVESPMVPEDPENHAWHLFMLRIDAGAAGMHRDEFINRMSEEGVGTSVHFIPLHLHPYWSDACGAADTDFPAATREFERTVSLPIFSSMTDGDVDKVIGAVRKVLTR